MENNNMTQKALLKKIRSYCFAVTDMLLFLDTHPEDTKAFRIYQSLVKEAKELMNEYQENYGPLDAFGAAMQSKFNWIDSPWPWEKEGN